MKVSQLSQAFPSPSVMVFHEILPRGSLNKLKSALLKCHVVTVCTGSCTVHCTICLSHFSQDFKLRNFMVAAAKAALDFCISVWFFLVCEQQVQQSIFTSWLIDHLHQEIIFSTLKKSGVLVLGRTLPADTSSFRPRCVPGPANMKLPPAFE